MAENNLLNILKERFEKNLHRHENIKWENVEEKLLKSPESLRTIEKMEKTGGEPDVVDLFDDKKRIVFVDFSAQSPKERVSLCYDKAAWDSRKSNKPESDAETMAKEIGITLLNEEQYKKLQNIEALDTKTSSWLNTPDNIRKLGGAIFGDRRFDTTFIYHNGAESYYAGRGFRGFLEI